MKNNFKIAIHEIRKKLNPSQSEIDRILFEHYNNCDEFSEKELISILEKQLSKYEFHPEVKELMEALNTEMNGEELTYELKDLYMKVERNNQGKVYNYPLNLLVNIINTGDHYDRMNMIVNELKNYEWIPDVKIFMNRFHSTPMERANAENRLGGRSNKVYTFVESVENGKIVWIGDKWFNFTNEGVVPTTLDQFFEGEKLQSMNRIQEALECAEINDERINFNIDSDLTLGIGVNKKGKIFINESETESETTLESLFNSPVIPFIKGGYYPIVLEAINGIDKFMELDVCTRITNIANPHLEVYSINWNGDAYAYRRDSRYGTFFTTYESVLDLVEEVNNELGFNISYFYPEKMDQDVQHKQEIEDKEQVIELELQEVKEAIKIIEENSNYLTSENTELTNAYDELQVKKIELEDLLKEIEKEKINLNHIEV